MPTLYELCPLTWIVLKRAFGILGLIMLPLIIWSIHQQRKHQNEKKKKSHKILYVLSIAVYICALIGSLAISINGFTTCSTHISASLALLAFAVQSLMWSLQWLLLIMLLFLRVRFVFKQSIYSLSKTTTTSFIVVYMTCVISNIIGFMTMYSPRLQMIYFTCYFTGIISGLTLAIYLPILFIFKLFQTNKKTIKNNDELSAAASKRRDALLLIIRKCAIVTTLCLISTWAVFACVIAYPFVMNAVNAEPETYISYWIIWAIALATDIYSNFFCVMLTNSFSDKYYMFICGWIDNWIHSCCNRSDNNNKKTVTASKTETQLSSYIQSTSETTVDSSKIESK